MANPDYSHRKWDDIVRLTCASLQSGIPVEEAVEDAILAINLIQLEFNSGENHEN